MIQSSLSDAIRAAVTTERAARHYGFEIKRSNFIACPFHSGDRTASLKIFPDGGWRCFGCNRGGSVIDFVMELFNVGVSDACKRLDADFSLGLVRETTFKERRQMARERDDRERERASAAAVAEYSVQQYNALCQYRRWLTAQERTNSVLFDIDYMDRLLDMFFPLDSVIAFDAAARINSLLSKHENRGEYDLHSGDY